MQVHGVGQNQPHTPPGLSHGKGPNAANSINAGAESAPAPAPTGDPAKAKGVIRLLQAGHFKGVADVRLRINFFDELQGLEHASLAAAAGTNVPGLLDAVSGKVDELLGAGELSDQQAASVGEAFDTFSTAVQQLVADFQNGGGTNTQAPLDGIQSAFDDFVKSLESILAPPDTSSSGDTQPSSSAVIGDEVETTPQTATDESESTPPPPSILETFITDLRKVFTDALGDPNTGLSGATTLSPLSEPSGNGAAYAKFLAIYNNLLAGTPNEPQASTETTIDAQV